MAIFLHILFSFLTVAFLGALFGFGLVFAAKLFAVKRDRTVSRLERALPGLNCGVCGYLGCAFYAEALSRGETEFSLCSPGGENLSKTLAKIMGVEVSYTEERNVTQVHCRGGKDTAKYLFSYRGLDDCTALYLLFGGDKECKFSCLGQGSCIKVCEPEAISYDEKGLIWVAKDLCTSCGKCVTVCPTGVMRFVPKTADYVVACNSTDKGTVVRDLCSVGCTACRACERRSPEGGFEVENNLARINYKRRGERRNAALACPPKCIVSNAVKKTGPSGDSPDTEKHA